MLEAHWLHVPLSIKMHCPLAPENDISQCSGLILLHYNLNILMQGRVQVVGSMPVFDLGCKYGHEFSVSLKKFLFRHLHPQVKMGTASDRYAGWLGQIYTEERYQGRIGQRTKVVGEHTFTEEVLPVDSVAEYFEHFPVLEIDFTFLPSPHRSERQAHPEPSRFSRPISSICGMATPFSSKFPR